MLNCAQSFRKTHGNKLTFARSDFKVGKAQGTHGGGGADAQEAKKIVTTLELSLRIQAGTPTGWAEGMSKTAKSHNRFFGGRYTKILTRYMMNLLTQQVIRCIRPWSCRGSRVFQNSLQNKFRGGSQIGITSTGIYSPKSPVPAKSRCSPVY